MFLNLILNIETSLMCFGISSTDFDLIKSAELLLLDSSEGETLSTILVSLISHDHSSHFLCSLSTQPFFTPEKVPAQYI